MRAGQSPVGNRALVGRVVWAIWGLRRVERVEAALWTGEDDGDYADASREPATGAARVARQFLKHGTSPLERLSLYEQRFDRALRRALRQLRQLRASRGGTRGGFELAVPPGAMPRAVVHADAQNEPTAKRKLTSHDAAVDPVEETNSLVKSSLV